MHGPDQTAWFHSPKPIDRRTEEAMQAPIITADAIGRILYEAKVKDEESHKKDFQLPKSA